jgi:two-component system response regulator YesN
MYSILVVDDDKNGINHVLSIFRKENLNISEIFTADSIEAAKKVLVENERIDILLTDIEMPNGSGLELVEWVREKNYETLFILFTCHTDFMYARKAVQLGCIDYLVKPVSEDELKDTIKNAQAVIDQSDKIASSNRFNQLWAKSNSLDVERFWYDLINRVIFLTPDSLEKMSQNYSIHITGEMRLLPIVINVEKVYKKLEARDESVLEYDLKRLAKETIIGHEHEGYTIQLNKTDFLVIILYNELEPHNDNYFEERCKEYISKCKNGHLCEVGCYIGIQGPVYDMADIIRRLVLLKSDNPANNDVAFLPAAKSEHEEARMPDISLWKTMLSNGEKDKVLMEIMVYLKEIGVQKRLDSSILYNFRQDLMQVIYYFLNEKGIQAHKLLGNETAKQLSEKSVRSVSDMQKWVQYLLANQAFQTKSYNNSQDLIENIKNYISSHLDEDDMSRDTISNYVFLNPDYMSRIFKKETGISITSYIIQERMDKAKSLLLKTEMPISLVATSVGYYHFSHFSKMFKKYFGSNPAEYRKRFLSSTN